jgi:hypothetical protein
VATTSLSFWEILSHLAMLQRQGVLVPLIGSGMSVPACVAWKPFVISLAAKLKVPIPRELEDDQAIKDFYAAAKKANISIPKALQGAENANQSVLLIRLADQVMEAFRPYSLEHRRDAIRDALNRQPSKFQDIPKQTRALAKIAWPLVMTTNYDDLYWVAATETAKNVPKLPVPEIVGRGLDDCHRVLDSLGSLSPPIFWALQGFLGGVATPLDNVIPNHDRQDELTEQVVLGHQQYQAVINGEPHFRRAFAEVLRRRCVLFLGSGLLEDYFVNLLSEIVHNHGTGSFLHFALFSADKKDLFNTSFLERRLGIKPIFYDKHEEVPEFLSALAAITTEKHEGRPAEARSIVTGRPRSLSIEIDRPALPERPLTVVIHDQGLRFPDPKKKECSAVSMGRDAHDLPIHGPQAKGHMKGKVESFSPEKWERKGSYTYRYPGTDVFGIVSRLPVKGGEIDQSDLTIIPESVHETLSCMDQDGGEFKTALLGAVASGENAPWHQIHPFAQMLRGIRQFALETKAKNLQRIEICLVGFQVWNEVIAGRTPVAQLLTTDLISQKVIFESPDGSTETIFVNNPVTTLGELMQACPADRNDWRPEIVPTPTGRPSEEEPGDEMRIAPTMIVQLTARSEASRREKAK